MKFQPIGINVDLPDIDTEVLSTDQRYLYMCETVKSGVCSKNLALRQPGTLIHSRWVIAANRILRLYVVTNEPSNNLMVLTECIMRVYAPIWFSIKLKSSSTEGPKH